jgi:hypothetical protein
MNKKRGGTSLIGREHLPSGSCTLENLKCLDEKVGTLGLKVTHRNRCSAAKKRARKAKLGEAHAGGQQPASHAPSTSGTRQGGPGSAVPKRRGHTRGPGKRQLSARNTPEGGGTKRPRQAGQLGYARAAQGGFRVAVVREDYPHRQVSKGLLALIAMKKITFNQECPYRRSAHPVPTPAHANTCASLLCKQSVQLSNM